MPIKLTMKIDDIIRGKGLRYNYVAKNVGIDEETLINWRKGRTYPRLNQAVKLAMVLGVEITELYGVVEK